MQKNSLSWIPNILLQHYGCSPNMSITHNPNAPKYQLKSIVTLWERKREMNKFYRHFKQTSLFANSASFFWNEASSPRKNDELLASNSVLPSSLSYLHNETLFSDNQGITNIYTDIKKFVTKSYTKGGSTIHSLEELPKEWGQIIEFSSTFKSLNLTCPNQWKEMTFTNLCSRGFHFQKLYMA